MTAALYIRVSTAEQNAELQRRELAAYAARRGFEIRDTFEDVASGTDRDRPALRRLLDACVRGRVECVLVWKLDRFGRSLLDCLTNLELLEREKVRFVAVEQNLEFDRDNPTSRLLLHILGAAAEFERELIRERVKSGLKRYRQDTAAGKVGTTVHSRSGKDLPAHRPRLVLPLDRIQKMRSDGVPVSAIAERLGTSEATVWRRIQARAASPPCPRPALEQVQVAGGRLAPEKGTIKSCIAGYEKDVVKTKHLARPETSGQKV